MRLLSGDVNIEAVVRVLFIVRAANTLAIILPVNEHRAAVPPVGCFSQHSINRVRHRHSVRFAALLNHLDGSLVPVQVLNIQIYDVTEPKAGANQHQDNGAGVALRIIKQRFQFGLIVQNAVTDPFNVG